MTLSTPSTAMRASVSCRAPSLIETIASTDATPRMMPSVASAERNLCSDRSSSAIRSASNRFIVGRLWLPFLQARLISAHQLAVAHVEHALDALAILRVVRDQNQRLPPRHQLIKEAENFLSGFFIEIPRRLIGQQQWRLIGQCPGN